MATLQGLALEFDDGPSMSLFKEGTEDFEWLNMDDNTGRKYMEDNNGIVTPIHASAGPTYDKTPKRATQGNNTKLPAQNDGDGPCFDTEPKLPRPTNIPRQSSPIAFVDPLVPPVQQVSPELHDRLAKIVSDSSARVKHVKKAVKKRTAQPPLNAQRMKKIKIEPKDDALYQQYVLRRYKIPKTKHGKPIPDFIEIEGFHTSLENFHASLKPRAEIDSDIMTLYLKTFNLEQMYNRKKPKKFAFSIFMGSQLAVDPGLFNPKSCEREFRRACENNQITKSDLLFIVVVQNRHWAVVVANLMHKQFNVFDSIKNSEDVTLLTNATNNVSYIPNLRKRIAANLLKHPSNNLDPAEQLRKLLED
ncbi:hypothetical protein D1007_29635 [Hordeum vulgare]|nr:hypothetical protein D1007_29635 [Hordeum vulgare]